MYDFTVSSHRAQDDLAYEFQVARTKQEIEELWGPVQVVEQS